ncbi:MAG: hypothetical protein KBS62_02645 [Oscillospiraceae bacterium]|nr:hypothetical protein [Candidatus Ruminococcus equi]
MKSKARKGLLLVFIAALLTLIGQIVAVIGTIIGGDTLLGGKVIESDTVFSQFLIPMILLLNSALVGIAATIIDLVGLYKASKQANGYLPAFVFSIFLILAQIVTACASAFVPKLQNNKISDVAVDLVMIIITTFVIQTTIQLLKEKGHEKLAKFGKTTLFIYVIGTMLNLLMKLFSGFLLFIPNGADWLLIASGIIAVAIVILTPLYEVFYVIFLGCAFKKV